VFLIIYFLIYLGAQQLEDPRIQWRKKRETMLCDYLTVAQSDLLVRKTLRTDHTSPPLSLSFCHEVQLFDNSSFTPHACEDNQ